MSLLDLLEIVGSEHGGVVRHADGFAITAGALTDIYVPPDGSMPIDKVPGLRLPLGQGPLRISARVAPRFIADFDAGALLVRTSSGEWGKLAFEHAPDKRTMAVSVVTKGRSDDANGATFVMPALYLRVYRDRTFYAFHVSPDGKTWDFLRAFSLSGETATIEFITQAPRGDGTEARFSEISQIEGRLPDLRNGN